LTADAKGQILNPGTAETLRPNSGPDSGRAGLPTEPAPGRDAGRSLTLDGARGAAIVAMVVYHTAWDLSVLRLADIQVVGHPAWDLFARAIAGSFLFMAGLSLALAHREGVRWRAFLRRLAIIAAAAAAVTVATRLVFPDAYVFYGILHAIALSSVVALPFTRLPSFAAALAALGFALGPFVPAPALFDAPALAFLGLASRPPLTNDFVPVFPWTGFVLAGVAAGRVGWRLQPGQAAAPGRAVAFLTALGRRSLVIYLAHQPIIFGALAGLVWLVGPNTAAEERPFLRACAASCASSGQSTDVCRAACACTVSEMRRLSLWQPAVDGKLSAAQATEVSALARRCLAEPNASGGP
jgi:uncharacterized membrane protein